MRRQLTIGFLLLRSDLFHSTKGEAVLEIESIPLGTAVSSRKLEVRDRRPAVETASVRSPAVPIPTKTVHNVRSERDDPWTATTKAASRRLADLSDR
jgi:hypothetical protein